MACWQRSVGSSKSRTRRMFSCARDWRRSKSAGDRCKLTEAAGDADPRLTPRSNLRRMEATTGFEPVIEFPRPCLTTWPVAPPHTSLDVSRLAEAGRLKKTLRGPLEGMICQTCGHRSQRGGPFRFHPPPLISPIAVQASVRSRRDSSGWFNAMLRRDRKDRVKDAPDQHSGPDRSCCRQGAETERSRPGQQCPARFQCW